MRLQYKENDIPYATLREFGISRQAVLDLPKEALTNILSGRLSPLLAIEGPDGRRYAAKIRLARDGEGKVSLLFVPRLRELDAARLGLSGEEAEKLRRMETILKDGKYMRLDSETNQLIQMRASDVRIDRMLDTIAHSIEDVILGEGQRQQIREGRPVEITRGDTKVTVGVDVNSATGLRVINGDLDEWRRRQLVEWDRLTPGATGYWQTTENGWEYSRLKEKQQRSERPAVERSAGRKMSRSHSMGS